MTSGNPLTTSAPRSGGDVLKGANTLVVLNEGFQAAFLACVVLAGIGVALALLLLGRPRKAPQERLEAVPVPVRTTKEHTVGRLLVLKSYTSNEHQAKEKERWEGS
jgi:hypothetical protein